MTALGSSIPGFTDALAQGGYRDQATRLRALVDAHRQVNAAEPLAQSAKPPVVARRRCPVITVTSGKGGVGKTNLCVNLAVLFARSGKRVTLVDADLGLANADVLLGLTPTMRLEAAIESKDGARTMSRIAMEGPEGVRLVPGSVGLPRFAELSDKQREVLIAQLVELEASSDVILIDTGAGIGPSVLSFVGAADLAVVVATPEPTAMADAYAMVKAVRASGKGESRLGLVINMAESVAEGEWAAGRISAVAERFLGSSPAVLGTLRRDGAIPAAVKSRKPFVALKPQSQAAQEVEMIASRVSELLNLGISIADAEPQGFWERLKSSLKAR
jgi:flagellar biosynthesis protein FlhG